MACSQPSIVSDSFTCSLVALYVLCVCDACFLRVLPRPAAVDTITADVFAALKALEHVIITTDIIVIIHLNRGGDVEPPNPSLRGIDFTASQHGVRDHLPAVSTSYCTGDNVDAFSQELASFLNGRRRIV